MRASPRVRSESGSALVEFVWLGIVLLVPMVWIVVSVFEVQRGAFAVHGAARAAARAYALAPDDATGIARAKLVARQVLDDQGDPSMPLELAVTCTAGVGHCHDPGSVITVSIASGVELPMIPDLLQSAESGFSLKASHTVPIGQYVQAPQ